MAWNEPGKPGQDPWGNSGGGSGKKDEPKGPKKSTDQDIDELLKKAQKMFGGAGSKFSGGIGGIGGGAIFLIVLVIWLLSGIYIVDTAERGVVTRFGAYVTETGPGPHWHIPYPIESVTKVNVDRIRTTEIGYRSDAQNRSGSVLAESLMLTRDENIVDVRIAVQYRVQSASDYLFNVKNPDESLRASSESAIREIVGKNSMDFVLTQGRNEVVALVRELTQKNLNDYQAGLFVTTVNLQDAQPPEQVQSAFADVVKAREDRERLINEAEAYANRILPEARGQAARIVEEARAYRDQVVSEAQGQADRFTSVVTEYKKSPDIMRERLYLDAMTTVLSKSSKVLMGSEGSNNIMYLPLDKMMGSGGASQPTSPFPPITGQGSTNRPQGSSTPANQAQSDTNIRDYLRQRELR
ncbi:MAG: FtsH protease activity modulator HflK [Thiomicrospira sp.]|uniref:FtsH protease activity modulator HflK n=1 Tax=Thiomicrospira sp. TaxID=935 RepID=UPI0019D8BA52|nr:FtsH protease activity modulator HflK [Thiomicrospira sp.]MBE0494279.1 FtsH protease activity modulator HflK [Thiomicrospira sp.]